MAPLRAMVSASITVMSAVTVRRDCSLREAVTTTVSSCEDWVCAWTWQASSEARARADKVRGAEKAEGERRAAPWARAKARVCMDAGQLRASDPAGTETKKTGCAACAAGRLLAGIQTGDALAKAFPGCTPSGTGLAGAGAMHAAFHSLLRGQYMRAA